MTKRLAHKIAVVTGAGSGIGHGCALMFAKQGAQVFAVDIDEYALEAMRRDASYPVITIEADLTEPSSVKMLFDQIKAETDHIDILVNAAAVAEFQWIEDMEYNAHWRHTITGELDTVFLVCKAAWSLICASCSGSIINIASANAHVALKGSAALAHTAGKGGVLAMTRQLAMEGAPHGIRANTISPGMIVTPATAPVLKQSQLLASVNNKLMLNRLGTPDDIAHLAVYLGSDESSYVTGADFCVDGGALAW